MILWIIAISLFVVLGVIGYYQGAIRVGFSLIGIVVAAALALPLSGLVKSMLPAFGLNHPVALAFVGPAIVYLLILIGFKMSPNGAGSTSSLAMAVKRSVTDRKSTRLNSSHGKLSRMPSSA